jgi:hypothetical protein
LASATLMLCVLMLSPSGLFGHVDSLAQKNQYPMAARVIQAEFYPGNGLIFPSSSRRRRPFPSGSIHCWVS